MAILNLKGKRIGQQGAYPYGNIDIESLLVQAYPGEGVQVRAEFHSADDPNSHSANVALSPESAAALRDFLNTHVKTTKRTVKRYVETEVEEHLIVSD